MILLLCALTGFWNRLSEDCLSYNVLACSPRRWMETTWPREGDKFPSGFASVTMVLTRLLISVSISLRIK